MKEIDEDFYNRHPEIFKTKTEASNYLKLKGNWYNNAHRIIPATFEGIQKGWMLQLK
jgi:hypothetical protein